MDLLGYMITGFCLGVMAGKYARNKWGTDSPNYWVFCGLFAITYATAIAYITN